MECAIYHMLEFYHYRLPRAERVAYGQQFSVCGFPVFGEAHSSILGAEAAPIHAVGGIRAGGGTGWCLS